MKLVPLSKLYKRNILLKNGDDVILTNVTSLLFFQFMANLEQSGSWILDAQSVKFTFSLTLTFILKNLKTELKTLQHSSHTSALSKGTIFAKNADFYQKNANIRKIKRTLVLKGTFSKTTYVCVLTYIMSRFQHNSKELQTEGVILYLPLPSPQNGDLKSPPRLGLRENLVQWKICKTLKNT